MAVYFRPPAAPEPTLRGVVRTVRKVGFLGSHTNSLSDAPWGDPSWELWGHASARIYYSRALDRYFDLHRPECWRARGKKEGYVNWLKRNTVPIYMPEVYPDVPASIRYPKGRILTEFSYAHSRKYFTNHLAWMAALAITEGVTHVGLWGINYGTETEYAKQRGCAEYWLGQLDARGIQVILPEQCTLLNVPASLYGYASHDEKGMLLPEWKAEPKEEPKVITADNQSKKAVPPPEIADQIAVDEQERPEWALGPLPSKPNGEIGKETNA